MLKLDRYHNISLYRYSSFEGHMTASDRAAAQLSETPELVEHASLTELVEHAPLIIRRRSRAEIRRIRQAIYDTLEERNPQTVRQLFYQLVSKGVVPKTEAAYQRTVCRLCGDMREQGDLPWGWLTDSTRWMRKPDSYSSLNDAVALTARTYRRALWDDQNAYVEIWCEKEALAGVLYEVTSEYDVPLMVVKGFPSKDFVHGAAATIAARGVPAYLYYCGDWDPSGLKIWDGIQASISRYEPDADVTFERIAVTRQQIQEFDLPTRPTKREGNTHAKDFDGESVEVDALPVDVLQQLVRDAIEQHINQRQLEITKIAEASERAALWAWSAERQSDRA
jgi:hypothetical protein